MDPRRIPAARSAGSPGSSMFRAYDVRGEYGKDLTEPVMERIGRAYASCIRNKRVVLAMDGRASSPSLAGAFARGLEASGKDVTDVGLVPLGAGLLHAYTAGSEYAYITASHLAKGWNGVKFFHPDGKGSMEDENRRIRDAYYGGSHSSGRGSYAKLDTGKVVDAYVEAISRKVRVGRKLGIVIDPGNGAASGVATRLFRKAGFSVESVFDRVDPDFPNRDPDPMKDPLRELSRRARGKDMGIAYDGDGDRMGVVDEKGRKLSPEQVAYIILSELLKAEKGDVVANVECTRVIDAVAGRFGRRVIRSPVGHTFLTEAVQRNSAAFGVEVSGHYVVRSVVPFDDSLAVSLYFAAALSLSGRSLSEMADSVPVLPFERVSFECEDSRKFAVVDSLKRKLRDEYGEVNGMDGVRVDFPDGWILIRASNTGPKIRLSVEAATEERLRSLRDRFSGILQREIKG
jgi:phosphomannomutase